MKSAARLPFRDSTKSGVASWVIRPTSSGRETTSGRYHSPLTTHHSPLTTHHSPLTTHHSLLYNAFMSSVRRCPSCGSTFAADYDDSFCPCGSELVVQEAEPTSA